MRTKKFFSFEAILVAVFVIFYTVAAISVSVNRFRQYDAFWYDFGILDEAVWKLSRFQLPVVPQLKPPDGRIVWGDHFNPSVAVLAPFYWMSTSPETILWLQVLFVVLSGLVFWIISRKVIESVIVRLAILVSYLGFVGLQNALYTDIHNIVFALLPLSLTFWAIFEKKWKLYFIFFILTLGFQESLALVGVGLCLFLILRRDRNIKIGLATIAISLSWGLFTTKFLMPKLAGGSYPYQPEFPATLSSWITGFFVPFSLKLKAIIFTFLTFGIFPIFSLAALPLIIFHYLERFVLNPAATRWDLGLHYNALLSPIMAAGALEVLAALQKKKLIKRLLPVWGILTILVVLFLHRFYLHGPLMLATNKVFYEQTKRAGFLSDFEKNIPRDGLLMTQNNLAAHFTHSKVTLLSKNFEAISPNYIAVDIRGGQNGNNFFPLSPGEFDELVASISASPNYTKIPFSGEQILFKHN